jgi:hypothetical protein
MKFLHLFQKEVEFGNIEGYDDIKDLLRRVLDSNGETASRESSGE